MKREEIEQAKKQAADIVNRQKRNIWDAKEYESEVFLEFAKLVAQATLERAAKVCKDKAAMLEREAMQEGCDDEDRTSLRSGAWLFSVCGNEIRALKDSND